MKQFKFLEIPIEVRNQFYELIEGNIYANRPYYDTIINEENTPFSKLIYLAWLFANDYITVHHIIRLKDRKWTEMGEVDPWFEQFADFSYDDYDGVNSIGFGINIWDTIHDLKLDTLAHLLKEKE